MKIAINGFGRIGRVFFRQANEHPDLEVVAINDLGDKDNLLYLLTHDSVYGKYVPTKDISNLKFFQEKDPTKLPWKDLGVDVVVESTGVFNSCEKSQCHLDAGAKRVVISAPAKDKETPFLTPGLFRDVADERVTSNASCTTNAVNPVVAVLMKELGIKKAALTTAHGYTATQMLVDGPGGKDMRRGRAAAVNIVPSTTGAAEATTKVIKELEGKFDGIALRVPVVSGSIIDLTFVSGRPTTVEEVNDIFKKASESPEWKGILKIADKQTVSTDILGEPYGSVVDLELTKVIDGDLVKVFSWYDNEWGYCAMLIKHIENLKKYL
jgi:glyceraldehyde 3-phosphate dehydrogenase